MISISKNLIGCLLLCASAGTARAQATIDVLINGQREVFFPSLESVEVSITLNLNGSTEGFFNSFSAWSQFAGDLVSGVGSFIAPVEGSTPGETQADLWEGRRPPAFPVPGGSAGGFRFSPDNSVTSGGTISNIEGIAASTALGGFSHDTAESIHVYRASLDLDGSQTGNYDVVFEPRLLQVFIDGFAIERAVLDNVQVNNARFVLPAPSAATPLLLAVVCTRWRRR